MPDRLQPRQNLLDALQELRLVLRKREFYRHVAIVDEILLLEDIDEDQFFERVQSGDVWGSAGSIFDIVFPRENSSPEEWREDTSAFLNSLIGVADSLSDLGVATKRVRDNTVLLRKIKKKLIDLPSST